MHEWIQAALEDSCIVHADYRLPGLALYHRNEHGSGGSRDRATFNPSHCPSGIWPLNPGLLTTIKEFRGWSSFSASLGTREGFLLASEVRGNPSTGKGSVQVDFTYPLSKVLFRNLDFYLYAQFFTGYGESLLEFDEKETRIRLGVGIVR